MAERHFTPAEVEALIPKLTEIMTHVMTAHAQASATRDRLHAEQQRIAVAGGALLDRAAWSAGQALVERLTGEIQQGLEQIVKLGGMPKDLGLGLVDFPHLRQGEVVNLCWKHGEREIRHWHGLDEGYAARKPL